MPKVAKPIPKPKGTEQSVRQNVVAGKTHSKPTPKPAPNNEARLAREAQSNTGFAITVEVLPKRRNKKE